MQEVLAFLAIAFLVSSFAIFWLEYRETKKEDGAGMAPAPGETKRLAVQPSGPGGMARYYPVGPEDMKRYFYGSACPAETAEKEEAERFVLAAVD